MAKVLGSIFLILCVILLNGKLAYGKCKGPYKGKRLSQTELTKVLARHKQWLKKEAETKANLCGSDLSKMNLSGVALQYADLSSAYLSETDLSGAHLFEANLSETFLVEANLAGADLRAANLKWADLFKADLTNANLFNADLTEANLDLADLSGTDLRKVDFLLASLQGAKFWSSNIRETNFSGADLSESDFSGADLSWATLSSADLTDSNLSNANLFGADLSQALIDRTNLVGAKFSHVNLTESIYRPRNTPARDFLGELKGLQTIELVRHGESGLERKYSGLALLRKALRDVGLFENQREATYVIEMAKTHNAGEPESTVRRWLFEYTVEYGLSPFNALWGLWYSLWAFTVIYWFPLVGFGGTGVVRIWPPGRVEVTPTVHINQSEWAERLIVHNHFKVFCFSFYFSLLSAFNIGWRDLNIGTWITRMQPRHYQLRATGWVRLVSGLQSILSVYLIAIWILTYFGRPFG